jgi:RHS repeat-associated protein
MKMISIKVMCATAALTTVVAFGQQPLQSSRPAGGHQTAIHGNSGPVAWEPVAYKYDPMGNITAIGTQEYTYDETGRLVAGQIVVPYETWPTGEPIKSTQSYTYDAYGNMLSTTKDGVSTSISVTAATNRLANATYDAAGSATTFQPPGSAVTYTYSYDALNMVRMVADDSGGGAAAVKAMYVYTADDERIWTYATNNVSHWKIRDLGAKVQRDFTDNGSSTITAKDYIYRNGTLLAEATPAIGGQSASEEHFSVDHLGTPRLVTAANGDKVGFHTYYPFGQEWQLAGNDTETLKFTGHERDVDTAGSGNDVDYMHARYYVANVGRFLSVDPVLDGKSVLTRPQGWNRYSYVRNNPLLLIDPSGRNAVVSCTEDNQCVVTATVQAVRDPNDAAAVATAADFKKNAEAYWNHQHLSGPNGEQVTFNVTVKIVDAGAADNTQDTMMVVNGSGVANVKINTPLPGRLANPGDHGLLFTADGSQNPSGHLGVDPHEMGHFFGLTDAGPHILLNWGTLGPTDDIMYYSQPGNSPTGAAAELFSSKNRNVSVVPVLPCELQ